jgi:hypothetical protein
MVKNNHVWIVLEHHHIIELSVFEKGGPGVIERDAIIHGIYNSISIAYKKAIKVSKASNGNHGYISVLKKRVKGKSE